MILTVTMNPSVDISYQLDTLKLNDVNRCERVNKTAGGKGLNVSRVLATLGTKVIATGVIGGTLGTFIKEKLQENDISHDFLEIKQDSRNCISILHDNNQQTEILETGPTLTNEELSDFKKKYKTLLKMANLVVVSGSLPKGAHGNFYAELAKLAADESIPFLLDTSGEPLREAILTDTPPVLIKPNIHELSDLLGTELVAEQSTIKKALSDPMFANIPWIVVSMGADGAIAKCDDVFYQATIPEIKAVNATGSGDATVAGLAMTILNNRSPKEVLRTAMTTGILNTLDARTGYIDPALFDTYYDKITIETI